MALLAQNQSLAHHPIEQNKHPMEVDPKDALANEHYEYVRIAADIRAKNQSLIRNCH